MKRHEAMRLIGTLVSMFPNLRVSDETLELYAVFLVDVEHETAIKAIEKLIATGANRFPTLADLRNECEALSGAGAPDGDRAWKEVLDAVARVGAWRPCPKFSHQAVDDAVASLSWREICLSDNADALRAHFAKAYEIAKRRSWGTVSGHALVGHAFRKHLVERNTAALPPASTKQLEGKK